MLNNALFNFRKVFVKNCLLYKLYKYALKLILKKLVLEKMHYSDYSYGYWLHMR